MAELSPGLRHGAPCGSGGGGRKDGTTCCGRGLCGGVTPPHAIYRAPQATSPGFVFSTRVEFFQLTPPCQAPQGLAERPAPFPLQGRDVGRL